MLSYVFKDYKQLKHFIKSKKLKHLCHSITGGYGMLYYNDNVEVSMGYLYNIWHIYPSFSIYTTLHKKIKIYYNEYHGFFILLQGKRFYINSLKEKFKEEFYEIQNS